jgi:putative FmdB family regulatory protein
MPTYEYECPNCGPFTAMRPMAEFDLPMACEECATAAPRVMLTAPSFACMPAGARNAHATNERSAHRPAKSGGRHPPSCGCCSGKTVKAGGVKSFPASRPWMISH